MFHLQYEARLSENRSSDVPVGDAFKSHQWIVRRISYNSPLEVLLIIGGSIGLITAATNRCIATYERFWLARRTRAISGAVMSEAAAKQLVWDRLKAELDESLPPRQGRRSVENPGSLERHLKVMETVKELSALHVLPEGHENAS